MIPFYRPFFNHAEMLAALRPGQGRAEFEAAAAARMGARYGLAFAYGRSGLFAVLRALEIEQAEVVLSAYTCVVVAQAIAASGNQPVFVDIDLNNYNMDLDALRQALTPHTRAIIATHLYGYPTDIEQIRQIVGDERILIIEDRAQRLLDVGKAAPRLCSDVAICSLGLNKELCAVQGGLVVTNSPDLYQRVADFRERYMNRHASKAALDRWTRLLANYLIYQPAVYGLLSRLGVVGPHHRLDENSNVTSDSLPADAITTWADFQGRIGLAQLAKLDTVVTRRRALAGLYAQALEGTPDIILPPLSANASYSYYTVRILEHDRLDFRQRMLARGVAVDETYEYALPLLKPYRRQANATYPNARSAASQVVNLPIYPGLNATDALDVAASVRHILERKAAV